VRFLLAGGGSEYSENLVTAAKSGKGKNRRIGTVIKATMEKRCHKSHNVN